MKVNCSYCNKRKLVTAFIYKKQSDFFCNQQCRGKWLQENTRQRITVYCEYCGKSYETQPHRLKRTKYCSRLCTNRAISKNRKTRIEITCKHCHKKFWGRPKRIYCSEKCQHLDSYSNKISIVCEYCGNTFDVLPSRSLKRFCNMRCAYNARIGKYRKPRQTKICVSCEVEFTVYPSREHHKYCKNCDGRHYEIAYSKTRNQGIFHHWYIGGTEKEYGRNWKKQSQKARKRDHNRCIICDKKSHWFFDNFPVHHIKPRREFSTLEELETIGNKIDNLITLCPSCHQLSEHGKYSRKHLKSLLSPQQ